VNFAAVVTEDVHNIAASIVSLMQLTSDVILYLTDMKDVNEDHLTIHTELTCLCALLAPLEKWVHASQAGDPWPSSVCALGAPNGLLEHLYKDLQVLLNRLGPVQGAKEVQKMIMWKFTKNDVCSMLNQIERLKVCVTLALQNNHLCVK
jgi:hypothetical protein